MMVGPTGNVLFSSKFIFHVGAQDIGRSLEVSLKFQIRRDKTASRSGSWTTTRRIPFGAVQIRDVDSLVSSTMHSNTEASRNRVFDTTLRPP